MYYLSPIVTWFVRQRFDNVHHFMEHPFEAQELVFQNLIQTAATTEWGKNHKYNSINNFEEFRKRIPVQDYDTLKPWINRMMKGEQNILWPSEIRWFAKSSGTTSDKSKFIPVSAEA
ncbi:MAG: GH3 auxin-responsive promoter family protein, partial [Bacteroidota bacterium]